MKLDVGIRLPHVASVLFWFDTEEGGHLKRQRMFGDKIFPHRQIFDYIRPKESRAFMNRQYVSCGLILICSCLLFIFLLLPQGKTQLQYELHIVRKNISLESIVAQMPNCTQYDRARQYGILHVLRAWSIFATEHRIIYWIAYGTLVGYVQRNGLLPHDKDADVLIPWEVTAKLEMLSRTNFSDDFYLVIQPLWRNLYYENRSYFRSEGIDFVAPNARFYSRNEGKFVDIWPGYERMPNWTSNALSSIDNRTIVDYDTRYNFMANPRDWYYPLQKCDFSGIPVWCPARPKKIVARIYGETAVNSSNTVCRNGTWA